LSCDSDPVDELHVRFPRLLAQRSEIQVVAEWLMSDRSPMLDPSCRRWQTFPHARWLAAFDGAAAAAGYGLFHELVAAGVPTRFLPNEHPEADNQLARVCHAEERGFGLCLRQRAINELPARLDMPLDPLQVDAPLSALADVDRRNGAAAGAAR
jgi:hypothetical protein